MKARWLHAQKIYIRKYCITRIYYLLLSAMNTDKDIGPAMRAALASPLRLEMVGIFTEPGGLSISDMAARLGRPATSLYHHVQVLEDAGVLRRTGTRPKGKRFETVYELARHFIDLDVDRSDPEAARFARQAMSAALRMAERDFTAAVERDDVQEEGPQRDILGMRMHICASAEVLARLNERIDAVLELIHELAAGGQEHAPGDRFVSLTVLLAPLRGRRIGAEEGEPQ
jgi:DNA-binding transcriptional ArsR family regulator